MHLLVVLSSLVQQSWAKACNLVVSPSNTLFICRNHFDSQYVTKYKLLPGAFPCLRLEPALSRSSSSADSSWVCPPVTVTYGRPKVALGSREEEDDITLREFERYSILEDNRLGLGPQSNDEGCALDSRERFARSARYYQSNALKLNKKIEELEGVIRDLEIKYQDLRKSAIIADESSSSDAKTFARMIVTKRTVFSDEERTLAQNINYMSNKSYSFMRDDLGFALPSKSSLLRWRPIRYVVPGFDANVMGNLEKISKKMSVLERNCVLLFDEITIKSDLTYNRVRDVIDGFVDFGEGHREMTLGNKCCFFMIKELSSHWKYVFSYYISKNGLSTKKLEEILNKNIAALKSIDLNVKALVCDQGPANSSLFNLLKISEETPFYMHENSKIYCLYDYCHLFKSVRNTFMKYDILTPQGIASFKVIQKLYSIDQSNMYFKICPKLTEAHVYPSVFEKMSVKRATQVLSNSVAAGIEMVYSQNLFGSDEYLLKCAQPTQLFVKKMNDLFDDLDCKNFVSKNPLKYPLLKNDSGKVQRLYDYIKYLKSMKLPTNAQVKCINGFCSTIIGMIQLSEELFRDQKELSYIFLGKMNQDALENFFYRVRASQGINSHPSAYEIQHIVGRLISMKIFRQNFQDKGADCGDDDDINLDWNLGPEDRHLDIQGNEPEYEQLDLETFTIPDENFVEEDDEADVQVKRYYTGYGIYQKILCKIHCEKCTKAMTKTQSDLTLYSEALIRAKNYKDDSDLRLVNPSDRVFEVCRLQMMWYVKLFNKYAHYPNVRCLMLSAIKEKTENVFPQWFDPTDECFAHKMKLLDYLVTVLLYKNSKWFVKQEVNRERHRKRDAKLKKLK